MARLGKISCCSYCASGGTTVGEDTDDIKTLHEAVRTVAVGVAPDVIVHATVKAVRKFISELPHPLAESNSMTWQDQSVTAQYRQTILDSLDLDSEHLDD